MILGNQRLAIQAALKMLRSPNREKRVVRIADTLHMDRIWVSEALIPEAESHPRVRVLEKPGELQFNEQGDLF